MKFAIITLLIAASFATTYAADVGDLPAQERKTSKPLKSFINLKQKPAGKLLETLESLMQSVLREEHPGIKVRFVVADKDFEAFHTGFTGLTQKHRFPLTWQLEGRGKSEKGIGFDAHLGSLAKQRRQVEHDFVYKVSELDKKRVHWPLVYDLMLRTGLTPEDFRFNNAAKMRLLTLEGKSPDTNYETISHALKTVFVKDMEPYHILGCEVPEATGLKASDILSHFSKTAARDSSIEPRGMIVDDKTRWFYVCLNNSNRRMLDLHGRKDAEGKYDGRNVQQADKDTQQFLADAYLNFRPSATVLTGRGKHAGRGGKRGALKKAFRKSARNNPLIDKARPIKGEGGFHVTLPEAPSLDLKEMDLKKGLERLIEVVPQAAKAGHERLRLILDPARKGASQDDGNTLIAHYSVYLVRNGLDFDFSLSEVPGELRLIFAKAPRA